MSFASEYSELRKKRKKSSEEYVQEAIDNNLKYSRLDIAPVAAPGTINVGESDYALDKFSRKTDKNSQYTGAQEEATYFKNPDEGNIAQKILGTAGDVGIGVVSGLFGMVEGISDLGLYGVAKIAEKVSDDKTLAEDMKAAAQMSTTNAIFGGMEAEADKYSFLGDKADNITGALGQIGGMILTGGTGAAAGLGKVGTTALTSAVTGASSMGSGMSEAYQGGATDEEAFKHGANVGAIDALSELMFGGLGKAVNAVGLSRGIGGLDDMFAQKLTSKISNQLVKNGLQFGVKAAGEGLEELVAGVGSAVSKKMTYMSDEELGQLIKDENLLDQFVAGVVGSGIAQSGYVPGMQQGSLREANKTGRDFITGYTANEQKVIDKEVENRIKEAEENGEQIDNKAESKIRKEVEEALKKGYISTDTIESVLGGDSFKAYKDTVDSEDAILKEYDELGKKENPTLADQSRYAELSEKVKGIKENSQRNTLKSKLSENVQGLLTRDDGKRVQTDDYLIESYNERARRGQAFEADTSKYDEKQAAVIQKAIDSGILNNTNRTHEFVDTIAKIAADRGVLFDFTNNAKLKESGFAIDGKQVNGYVTKDGITLNVDSPKAWQSTVGHEVTHILEGTELYTELQTALFDYAKSKKDYDSRRQTLENLYKDVKDANVDAELTADLVGDYLFTDEAFVANLSTKHRNVFQKIYDEIKHLLKMVTAGSKEARELERVKRAFDKAYREGGKADAKGDTKYSLSDSDGKQLTKGQQEFFKDSKIRKNGNLLVCYHATDADFTIFDKAKIGSGNGGALFGKGFYFTPDSDLSGDYGSKLGKYYLNIKNPFEYYTVDKEYIVDMLKKSGYEYDKQFVESYDFDDLWDADFIDDFLSEALKVKDPYAEFSKMLQNAGFDGIRADSEIIAFEPEQIKRTDNANPTSDPDTRYSLSDSDGKQLTKEQSEYFKDSKVRDENGNLKVMYHGTRYAGFHEFDSDFSDDDRSFFFVDRNDVAQTYSGTSETYAAPSLHTAEDFNKFFAENGLSEYSVKEEVINGYRWFTLYDDGVEVASSETAKMLYDEFRDWSGLGEGEANYKVYLNLTNPLVVDAEGRNWNRISGEFSQEIYDRYQTLTEAEKEALVQLAAWEDASVFRDELETAVESVERDAHYVDDYTRNLASAAKKLGDADKYRLFDVATDGFTEETLRENAVNYLKTRDYAQRAKEQGYDGVIFKNIVDNGGYSNGSEGASTVAIAFNSNQIKSVANEKPTGDADIRYSLSKDSDGRQLSDGQKDYFKNSKVVDDNGNLLVVYHGSPSKFTVFDHRKMNAHGNAHGRGFYFTENKSLAEGYEKESGQLLKGYLNIEKPLSEEKVTIKKADLVKLIKATCEEQAKNLVADGGYSSVREALPDTWISNYVMTYGMNINDAYREVANIVYSGSDNDVDIIAELTNGGAGNATTLELTHAVLGYDGVIYTHPDGTHEFVSLISNQFKNIDNANPTANPDVRYSLTEQEAQETNEKLKGVGLDYDAKTETVSFSLSSLEEAFDYNKGEADYRAAREEYVDSLVRATGKTREEANRYLDSLFLVHDMIAADRDRLDYEAAVNKSAWVSNSEYGGSIDFSTLCAKRRLFTGTFDAIQNALPDTVLNENDFLKIRDMLLEKELESPCSMCYVEGSRAKHGVYVAKWLKEYLATNPEWKPQIADFTSSTRLEQTRINHPEAYAEYQKAMNKLAQRKPKEASVRTDYKGEILDAFADDSTVAVKNKNGGIRFNSFSDFEIIHALDCMQVLTDMARVGLNGQAYTKVKEFAESFGNTGLKINLSLVAKDVDENGKLIMDEVNGMKYAEAMDIRNKYSENVGTVIVVFNDAQLKAALADSTIDYVLPFHRSQWKKSQYTMMGLPTVTKDYTALQNDRITNPKTGKPVKLSKLKMATTYTNDITGETFIIKDNIMPNEYWDYTKSGRDNANRYLDYINANGMTPKFDFVLDKVDGKWVLPEGAVGDGYFKLLIDFKMYDNDGWGSPQKPVLPEFNMPYIQQMLDNYIGGHQSFPVAHDVVDAFVEGKKNGNFSLSYEGDAPIRFRNGVPMADLRLETQDAAPVQEDIAPVAETVDNVVDNVVDDAVTSDAPVAEPSAVDLAEIAKQARREELRGTYIQNGKQYISDGSFIAELNASDESLEQSKDFPIKRVLKELGEVYDRQIAGNYEIDTDITEGYIKVGDSLFDAKYVNAITRAIENPTFALSNVRGGDQALLVTGDNGRAMLMPVRAGDNVTVTYEAKPVDNVVGESILPDDLAPMQETDIDTITDKDAPPEAEAPYQEAPTSITPSNPFDSRDIDKVGNPKVKSFAEENPEVKPFFKEAANAMLGDLRNTTKGERHPITDEAGYIVGWDGAKRQTTEDIAYLLDNCRYTYLQIENGLNAIINDGKYNAVAKRIEFLLNDRLMQGYTDAFGNEIPSNQEYLNLLSQSQVAEEVNRQNAAEQLITAPPEEDIAPVAEKYEAIRPKREPKQTSEPRMKRVDSKDGKQRKWVGTSTKSDAVDGKILPDDLDQKKIFYQPITNKATLKGANERLDSMGYEASVTYFNGQFSNKKTTVEDIVLGERLIQEAIKRGDTKTAGELIEDVAILGTELGQKVQALSIIKRLTPEGQLRMLKRTVERGKTRGDKAFEGVEITQEMIDHILKTYGKDGKYDQAKLNEAVEDVKQQIADKMKVTKWEKVNAWRYLSMLGNPKTHIRNLVSNVAMRGTVAVKNAVARTIEDIAPVGNRTKTWKAASDEVKAFAQKTTEEMKDVLQDGGKYNEDASLKAKRQIFKNNVLNKVYEFNSELLSKEDWWFSRPAFSKALSEFLTANGITTAEDIKNNPKLVEKAKKYATEQSQIATFRQYSWLANKINEIESKNVATSIAVGAVLPFKKTPINIAKTGLAYSPLGFAKTLTYDISQVKKGNMDASTLVDHLSQNITGTGLALIGYLLASAGFLNGGGEDDKEGDYDYQLGEQAYSVNIGGASYSLSWLSPVAMPLFVGANAYEQLVEGKEWNGDVVVETLAQTLDPLSEMSFVSGLDSVLSSYDSGIEKFAGIAESAAQNYITQFAPTVLSQFAAVTDDTKRSTKVASDSDFKFVDETVNKLKYKIPGLRNTLEPSTDIWGNDIKQSENWMGRAFENFLAPYAKRENIASAVDEEIKSLYSETGDNGLIPDIPYNYVNYKGEKYEMSAEDYTAYKHTYGQTAFDLMEELFGTETYRNADSNERADLVNKVYDYARDEAKREYLSKYGVDFYNSTEDNVEVYKENPIKGAIENDMMPDEYAFSLEYPGKYEFFKQNGISYRTYKEADEDGKRAYSWAYENPAKYTMSKAIADDFMTYYRYKGELDDIRADKDENGKSISGSAKEKKIEYINNLDLDYGSKIILFRSMYDSEDDRNAYNQDIVDYLNSREDISYEEMSTILKELGFTVTSDGSIYW